MLNTWDQYARDYDTKVYSITKYPEKRARIIRQISDQDNVLIVGCGSITHLQQELLQKRRIKILATDFSEAMLTIARLSSFQHEQLRYEQHDTRALPYQDTFNKIISTNSIIPEQRTEVRTMFKSIFKALKRGGRFIAYLPSYSCGEEFCRNHPNVELVCDPTQLREYETSGWQCFHTEESIQDELGTEGFTDIHIEHVPLSESPEAEDDLFRLYSPIGVEREWLAEAWQFFVTGEKHTA